MAGQGDLTISVPTPQDLKAMSPRHQVFMELLHTEMNYVEILETIVEVWCYLLRVIYHNIKIQHFIPRCSKSHLRILAKLEALCLIPRRSKSFLAIYHLSMKSISSCLCNLKIPHSTGEKTSASEL